MGSRAWPCFCRLDPSEPRGARIGLTRWRCPYSYKPLPIFHRRERYYSLLKLASFIDRKFVAFVQLGSAIQAICSRPASTLCPASAAAPRQWPSLAHARGDSGLRRAHGQPRALPASPSSPPPREHRAPRPRRPTRAPTSPSPSSSAVSTLGNPILGCCANPVHDAHLFGHMLAGVHQSMQCKLQRVRVCGSSWRCTTR
jgi:hypothetical protein